MGRIIYPEGVSAGDRRHCRRMIASVANTFGIMSCIVVSCSGGIDSTVLVHALGQALRINPKNNCGENVTATAVYLNHNLRPAEVKAEAVHVEDLARKHLSFVSPAIELNVPKGAALQERARNARYKALRDYAEALMDQYGDVDKRKMIAVATAHNANDNVETKLYQFLKSGKMNGIATLRRLAEPTLDAFLIRPFLSFTREDIVRYARVFQLTWCEDSSNSTDQYTRNKIRHHLIPWIESNINPGLTKMLNA